MGKWQGCTECPGLVQGAIILAQTVYTVTPNVVRTRHSDVLMQLRNHQQTDENLRYAEFIWLWCGLRPWNGACRGWGVGIHPLSERDIKADSA